MRHICDALFCLAEDAPYYIRLFSLVEGLDEQVKLKEAMDGVYAYEYYPNAQGKYTVSITWGGQHIPKRWVSTEQSSCGVCGRAR